MLGNGKIALTIILPHKAKQTLTSSFRSANRSRSVISKEFRSWGHFFGTGALSQKKLTPDHLWRRLCMFWNRLLCFQDYETAL